MGVVHSFKCKYRQQVIREKLQAIEYSNSMPTIDIYKAIMKVKVAWDSVSQTTLKNCFRKAGFRIPKEPEPEEIEEPVEQNFAEYLKACEELNLREEFNFTEYEHIDDYLPAQEQYSDECVTASIEEETPSQVEEDDSTPTQQINKNKAIESLHMLREFMIGSSADYKAQIDQLFKMESAITMKESIKQTTILQFFTNN